MRIEINFRQTKKRHKKFFTRKRLRVEKHFSSHLEHKLSRVDLKANNEIKILGFFATKCFSCDIRSDYSQIRSLSRWNMEPSVSAECRGLLIDENRQFKTFIVDRRFLLRKTLKEIRLRIELRNQQGKKRELVLK